MTIHCQLIVMMMNSCEIENELDDKEHTADKVAPSVADLIHKTFWKGLFDEKLITRFSEKI